jgi:hypothetical protein
MTDDRTPVLPDHYSYRAECTRENLKECLTLMAKNGMQEWRATENPEGYPPGLYVEGWDRKLRYPEREADFNYPMVAS